MWFKPSSKGVIEETPNKEPIKTCTESMKVRANPVVSDEAIVDCTISVSGQFKDTLLSSVKDQSLVFCTESMKVTPNLAVSDEDIVNCTISVSGQFKDTLLSSVKDQSLVYGTDDDLYPLPIITNVKSLKQKVSKNELFEVSTEPINGSSMPTITSVFSVSEPIMEHLNSSNQIIREHSSLLNIPITKHSDSFNGPIMENPVLLNSPIGNYPVSSDGPIIESVVSLREQRKPARSPSPTNQIGNSLFSVESKQVNGSVNQQSTSSGLFQIINPVCGPVMPTSTVTSNNNEPILFLQPQTTDSLTAAGTLISSTPTTTINNSNKPVLFFKQTTAGTGGLLTAASTEFVLLDQQQGSINVLETPTTTNTPVSSGNNTTLPLVNSLSSISLTTANSSQNNKNHNPIILYTIVKLKTVTSATMPQTPILFKQAPPTLVRWSKPPAENTTKTTKTDSIHTSSEDCSQNGSSSLHPADDFVDQKKVNTPVEILIQKESSLYSDHPTTTTHLGLKDPKPCVLGVTTSSLPLYPSISSQLSMDQTSCKTKNNIIGKESSHVSNDRYSFL